MTRRIERQETPDAAWIREVLERHERPLTLYASRLLGDVERARDVVQETFLRLLNQNKSEREECKAVWLFTVCRNLCFDVRRKESRMSVLNEESASSTPSTAASPQELAETADSVSRAFEVIQALPEKQQEVLRLKFQHGLSYKEIASVTQDSIGNVGWLLHEGLKGLRGRLATGEAQGAQA
jgi:RNA polymerase sigma factor (sigma-70 family)